jgi:hypothetical protein
MRTKILAATTAVVSSLFLAACGGGSDSAATPAATTLSGTAAVGAPIVKGSINVVCAGGSPLSTETSSTGAWQVTTSGQTLPCAVQVNGGTIGGSANTTPYHSIAMSLGTVNITPLTDLVVANLAGKAPSAWFTGISAATLQGIANGALNTALGNVNTALGLGGPLNGANPLTTPFSATNGDLIDDILEAMAYANENAGSSYASLLALAAGTHFSAPAGFNFSTAYAAVTTPGTNTPASCAAGETALTYSGSGPYTNGQKLCFVASSTALKFSGKTLGSPTKNTVVSAPYAAYSFADGGYVYEVVFKADALYEINVSDATKPLGKFAAPASGGTGGTGSTGGLQVEVSVNGLAGASVSVDNVPAPSSQSEFCGGITNDPVFQNIGTGAGGTLTINSCSFSGKVGTINATMAITTPIAMTVPYSVTYTYQ